MLILARKQGQSNVIGGNIVVKVIRADKAGGQGLISIGGSCARAAPTFPRASIPACSSATSRVFVLARLKESPVWECSPTQPMKSQPFSLSNSHFLRTGEGRRE